MTDKNVIEIRKLSQKYAYASIQMHETIARNAGFASTDHKYLGFFLQKGSMTAGELADLTGLTTGSVTNLIDRFENKNLIERQFDSKDRRKVIIVPNSEKILALMQPFYTAFQEDTDNLIASFSDNELKILESFFAKATELATKTNDKFKK
jgi:DNA-binding MarR family transcriptional regulator